MKKPVEISVIIPNYNREDLLQETLESLLQQTITNWEAIIVDDGSTDSSLAVAERYQSKDSRFKVVKRTEFPKGAGTCRNQGLSVASGNHIIFLDSDDKLASFCLEKRYQLLQDNPGYDFLVFQIACFTKSSDNLECYWNIGTEEPDLERFMKLDAVWQTSSVMWNREFIIGLGGFDPQLACWQDVDIHLRAMLTPNVRYKKFLDEIPDVYYRRHAQHSISQQNLRSKEKLLSRKIIIKKIRTLLPDKKNMSSKLQPMVCNVVLSASGSPYYSLSLAVLMYAKIYRIISWKDTFNLLKMTFIKRSKLFLLPGIGKLFQKKNSIYLPESLVCKIPIQH